VRAGARGAERLAGPGASGAAAGVGAANGEARRGGDALLRMLLRCHRTVAATRARAGLDRSGLGRSAPAGQ